MSEVSVSLGMTMNIGGYESLRFDYSITDSVRNYEDYNDALVRVEKVVEEKLLAKIKQEREGF